MFIRYLFFVIILFLLQLEHNLFSQETTRSPASFDFNEKGITFATSDSLLQVIMRFRIQNSVTFTTVGEDDLEIETSDMSIRRMRLRFGGSLYDPRLSFNLQLSFARGDLDYDDTQFPNIIRDAAIFWNFSKNAGIGLGQTKLPGNRQRVISSGDLQFADRSLVNSRFSLDRDFGLQGFYSFNVNNIAMNVRGAISSGDGRYATRSNGANFAYTGRFEVLPFGKFTSGGDYFESDLIRESKPKLSLGATYSENKKSYRTRGQLGARLFEERDQEIILIDALLKYRGFAIYTEYAQRFCDDPITYDTDMKAAYVYIGKGYLAQLSYLFMNNFEIASRMAVVSPDKLIYSMKGTEWNRHITSCFTYYLSKHRAKFQLELTHNTLENKQSNVSKKNWIGRLNAELGI